MRTLRNNIGIFTESGGTIGYLISDDGCAVIDTQFPDQSRHLVDEINKKSEGSIKYLINTHHHGDHTAGNVVFKGLANKIVAHENSLINQRNSAVARGTEDKQHYPDTTFKDQWKGEVAGENISIQYYGAGHTNGDSVTHFLETNVAHVGDLVFNRRFPYIDKNAGANIKNWALLLRQLNEYFDSETIIICGHSDNGHDVVIERADLIAFAEYLENLLSQVGAAVKAGQTDDEILTITEIKGSPEWKGKGISRSLKSAIQELRSE